MFQRSTNDLLGWVVEKNGDIPGTVAPSFGSKKEQVTADTSLSYLMLWETSIIRLRALLRNSCNSRCNWDDSYNGREVKECTNLSS